MFQKFAERDSKVRRGLVSNSWSDRYDLRHMFHPLTLSSRTERNGEDGHQAERRGSDGDWQRREGSERSPGLDGALGASWLICSSDFCHLSCWCLRLRMCVGESTGFWVCVLFLAFSLWLLTQAGPPQLTALRHCLCTTPPPHPLNSFPPHLWIVDEFSVFQSRKRH